MSDPPPDAEKEEEQKDFPTTTFDPKLESFFDGLFTADGNDDGKSNFRRDGAVTTKIGFSVVVSVGGEQTVEERFQFRVERSRGEVFLFLLLLCIGRRVGHFDFAFVCVIMRVKWKWRKTSAFCSLVLFAVKMVFLIFKKYSI